MPVPDALQPFVDRPEAAALLTDFDGTLAPIVDDPAAARPLPAAIDALQRLARRLGVVGVISGRPVSFLRQQVGDGMWLSGLYGLEQVVGGERRQVAEAERWRPVVDGVAADARRRFGDLVEEKGLSLTLHFRTAPDREDEVREFARQAGARTDLEVRAAKASVELHPPVPADKGTAVAEMAVGHLSVCFLGDDVGDLPAFGALDRLALDGVHAVRIAVRTSESPAEMLDRADVVVDGPEGAVALLTDLAGAVDV